MSDRLLPNEIWPPLARKWLVGVWILSTVLGTTAWWASLAWAAIRLAQVAS